MQSTGKRLILLGATAVILAGAVYVITRDKPHSVSPVNAKDKDTADKPAADMARMWTTFGGTTSRNMVNTIDKHIVDEWVAGKKKEKWENIKWAAKLGSKAY